MCGFEPHPDYTSGRGEMAAAGSLNLLDLIVRVRIPSPAPSPRSTEDTALGYEPRDRGFESLRGDSVTRVLQS